MSYKPSRLHVKGIFMGYRRYIIVDIFSNAVDPRFFKTPINILLRLKVSTLPRMLNSIWASVLLLSTRYGYFQFVMVRLKTKSTVLTTAAFGVRSLLLTVIMVLYEFFKNSLWVGSCYLPSSSSSYRYWQDCSCHALS